MEDAVNDATTVVAFDGGPELLDTNLFSIDTKEAQKMLDTMERISIQGNIALVFITGIVCYTVYKIFAD